MSEFDIFNLGVNDVDTHKEEEKKYDFYKPSASDGKDGVYRALIRFVPNPNNPRMSLVRKWVHWLKDSDGNGRLVDSPSSIGQPCPIADAFFKLRNSKSALDQKMSENLKRREQYFAIVKIIKDPQDPSLDGQYKIFKFGYKIKEKIDEELNPAFGEPTQVFDLFNGKNFELVISRQGEYNNYDKSKFSAQNTPIQFGDSPLDRTQESMQSFKEDLIENAPDLGKYEYQPWDDDTRDFVNKVIGQYVSNPGAAIDNVVNKKKITKKEAAVATVTQSADDDFMENFNETETATTNENQTTESDDVDDLDSFLDGLNSSM